MCDETFNKDFEEALRLAKIHRVVTTKKREVVSVREEVKKLKEQLDEVTSDRRVASQR